MIDADCTEQNPAESGKQASTISPTCARLQVHVAITPAQLRVVRGIDEGFAALGAQPTCREVALLADLSASAVRDHVVHLRRIGVVAADSMRVVRRPTGIMLRRSGNGWSP